MELFSFLEGISPWWWVAFGIVLGVVEMATMSFFLIWPAIAALCLALMNWMVPSLSGEIQISVFAILSVGLTFLGRAFLLKYGDGGEANLALNARSNLMVGRHAEVVSFIGPEGKVTIDGVHWRAIWPEGSSAEPGSKVEIARADGMTLFVKG